MTITLRRWRPRPLECGIVVETSRVPDRVALECDPILQIAPLTGAGRAMILEDDYSPGGGHAIAWSVRRATGDTYGPVGMVIWHCYTWRGTQMSRKKPLSLWGDELVYDMKPVIQRNTWRTSILTRKSVQTIRGRSGSLGWIHLAHMLAAEDSSRSPRMSKADLAALGEVEI